MYRVMYKDAHQYVADRDGVFYYVRRVPHDVRQHYASARISFSLRTKSHQSALRAAKSVTQRLEDYWLGLRLQQMDIPAIHLVKTDDVEHTSPLMMDAVEMYLSIKGKDDRTFIRTARRNGEYVSKLLGNRPITSYSSLEAAQFRDWCFQQGMNINTVKRVFASVRSIINLTMREHGIEGRNAFSGTFMPDRGDASTRQPIPVDKLRTIQQRCQTTDDEPRWLVALISDTGMRLSRGGWSCQRRYRAGCGHPPCHHPSSSVETFEDQRQRENTAACRMLSMGGKEDCRGITTLPLPLPSLLQ